MTEVEATSAAGSPLRGPSPSGLRPREQLFERIGRRWYQMECSARDALSRLRGNLQKNSAPAYWWARKPNFGDWLNPYILGLYGVTPIRSTVAAARTFSIGSILQAVPEDFTGDLLGPGLISGEHARRFPRARFRALRGELTKRLTNAPENVVLGDPGLLAGRLLRQRERKRYAIGIVPHYTDQSSPGLIELLRRHPREIHLIDVRWRCLSVVREIDRCETIVASSLHGLVVADALGIPNVWFLVPNDRMGGDFKYHDYYSGLGCTRRPLEISGSESPSQLQKAARTETQAVADGIGRLDEVFRQWAADVKGLQR